LLWAKGLSANAIQSEMRPVYSDKCFTRPAIHAWCKKLLMVTKVCWCRTWSQYCFDNWCNDCSGRFPHAVWLACDEI